MTRHQHKPGACLDTNNFYLTVTEVGSTHPKQAVVDCDVWLSSIKLYQLKAFTKLFTAYSYHILQFHYVSFSKFCTV